MANPIPAAVGIVIRKDGTVPFDDDVETAVHDHIVGHLLKQGHHLAPVEGTRHYKITNWKQPAAKDK